VVLVLLGISARWAPTLTSLLVIVVMLHYARYAWSTVAKIPPGQLTELLVLATFALGVGFLAKLGAAPLIITGVFLLVTVPLWRLARHDPREHQDPPGSEGAERP
jgi:hypothetical protein